MNSITFEEYLGRYGTLTYKNVGVSMLPLIRQGRDAFILRAVKPGETLKKWDVVLYKRPPDAYVLHRIIDVKDGTYDILGDNCVAVERNIPKERVIGVMTGFIRKNKEYAVAVKRYRIYVTLRCKPYHVRTAFKRIWMLIKRVGRTVLKSFAK